MSFIKQIPNALTTLRLVLTVPIFLLIVSENYQTVLWIFFIAGISDGFDGLLARKLNALSRYGAVADPLFDKILLNTAYVAFAVAGLQPWWLVMVIVTRDIVIISGALLFHWLYGRYEIASSFLGKCSTFVQIVYALMLLFEQIYHVFPAVVFQIGIWILILLTLVSGSYYVFIWGGKARKRQKENHYFPS